MDTNKERRFYKNIKLYEEIIQETRNTKAMQTNEKFVEKFKKKRKFVYEYTFHIIYVNE